MHHDVRIVIRIRAIRLASSSGAKPVPYRRIPLTSPSASLNAVPSAIAVSCVSAEWDEDARSCWDYGNEEWGGWGGLISCMMVIDPEIAFGLERERHSAVFRKGIVHLSHA